MQPSVPTHPAAFGHWQLRGGSLECRLPRSTVHVTAPAGLLSAVARLCDGRLGWRDVAAELARRWDAGQVEAFLAGLSNEGVLVQSGHQLAHWAASPPPPHASVGTFGDVPLPARVVRAIAAALGVGAVGTAPCGAPPLELPASCFAFVLRPLAGPGADPLAPGLYRVGSAPGGRCAFEPLSADADAAWSLLPDPRVLQFASAVLVQAVQLAPTAEPGAPAQAYVQGGMALRDAEQAARAHDAAALVRHDVDATALRNLLAPQAGGGLLLALPLLVLGAPAQAAQDQQQRGERWIRLQPAPDARPPAGRHAWVAGPFATAAGDLVAAGRAADPRLAVVKAEAEAWERLGWATLAPASRARRTDVPGAVDPATLVCYSARQHRRERFPFRPFDPRADYLWLPGQDALTGRTVHVPADLVHAYAALPPDMQQRALTASSTSGMAAGSGLAQALERATLELVERHAFLLSWIHGAPLPALDPRTLPGAAGVRVRALRDAGHAVTILRLPCELAPVYAVFTQCQQPPMTGITAAADFDPEAALHKALDEAESRALAPRASAAAARPRGGVHAIDRAWRSPGRFRRADWYAAGPAVDSFSQPALAACRDWRGLLQRLRAGGHQVFAIDVTPPGASVRQGRTPLHVVRAAVPGLLPIWFEQGLEPAGLPAYRQARSQPGGVHRHARLALHPFA